ncbi:O-antigen ligase family protein, partial [uncultured Marinobacter sp.]|uniref:O-antigen ligase family protein n=1 Tax=uncultured Marinobacter sp. TaxID=187379 RepID=UPI002597981A
LMDIRVLSFVFVLFGFFILSLSFNIGGKTLDLKPLFNGLLPFSIVFVYTWVHRHDINFEIITKLYSVSFIVISLFGFYSFSRFLGDGAVISLLNDGLSEQLWRLAGGKTQYIPALLLLSLLSSQLFVNRVQPIVFMALSIGLISISVSSQRTALVVIPFVLYSLAVMLPKNKAIRFFLFLLVSALAFYLFKVLDVIEFFNNTFLQKIQAASSNEQGRLSIWLATITILTSSVGNFLLGVGFGSLSIYNYHFWPIDISDPHSIILYFWSFGGLGAALVIMMVLLFLLVDAYKVRGWATLLFTCTFVGYWVFAGFYFYVDTNKSDFNLLVVCLLFSFVSVMKERKYDRYCNR